MASPLTTWKFNNRMLKIFSTDGLPVLTGNSYQERYMSGWYTAVIDRYKEEFSHWALSNSLYGQDFMRRNGWRYGYAYEAVNPLLRGYADYMMVVVGEIAGRSCGTRFDVGQHTCLPYDPASLDRIALASPSLGSPRITHNFEQQLSNVDKWRAADDLATLQETTQENHLTAAHRHDCIDPVTRTLFLTINSSAPPDVFVRGVWAPLSPVEYADNFRPGTLLCALVTPVNFIGADKTVRCLLAKSIHIVGESPELSEQHGVLAEMADRLCSFHF